MTNTKRMKLKLVTRLFAVIFILTLAVLSVLSYMDVRSMIRTMKLREYGSVLLKVKSIENHLNPVVTDITLLVSDQILQDFINNRSHENRKRLQKDFLMVAEVRDSYDQIRYIDNRGMEIVRINNRNGKPVIVPDSKLQSKKDRYYFKNTISLNRGEIYASPFDLNVEGGKIEQPVKPMIRIGMPVFDSKGRKRGIVIINYRGDDLLDEFSGVRRINNTGILSRGEFWLLNSEGYYLKGPSGEKEWAFMYPDRKEISFAEDYPAEWEVIRSKENGQIMGAHGLFTYATVYPFNFKPGKTVKIGGEISKTGGYKWKVLSFVSHPVIKKDICSVLWKYILIFIFINAISLFGSIRIAGANIKNREAEKKIKKALGEAEDANKAKSEFLANMSHEIRTPMNSILGFSELLMERIKDGEEHEFIKEINTSGKNLLSLINDILDLSIMDSAKIEIRDTSVDIRSLLDDLKMFFRVKAGNKGIDLRFKASGDIPETVIMDGIRLRQILINIIGNAVKFTEKGYVKVTADIRSKKDSDHFTLVIDIEDTGIGIPEESRSRIFEPFEQAGKGSLAKYGGTGLGLAISRRLIKIMNGTIEVVHKKQPGTIFRLTFHGLKRENKK